MKILWIDLNCSYAHSSLALPALHAQMAHRTDIQWEMVSATINENIGMIVNEIYSRQPDIIAATNWLFNHETLMHVTARVKALLPQACLIMGGPEFLGDNEEFLRRNPFVNYVLRGEGEEVFPQWLDHWQEPEAWREIPGMCFLDSEKNYVDNGIARVLDFENLKAPEEDEFFNWSKPFVQLETTRGCFNTCAFCVSGGEKPVRSLSMDAIRDRLKLIHEHGIQNVRVLDRTFNFQPKRAKALLDLFKEYYPHIRFHLEIHPALLTQELKDELKKMPAGLLHLEAGIQSLREPVLVKSRRKGTLKNSLEGLTYLCAQENLVTHADLIAGLPLYHLEEIFEDVYDLAQLYTGEIQLESLKLLPGTVMRQKAKEWGIRYSPFPPYEVLETDEITTGELQTARRLSRLLDAYYNTPAWQELTRRLILNDRDFLHKFLKHLTYKDLIDQPLSLERRGLILYEFCKKEYPEFTYQATIAWLEAGMSLKKQPAERIKTRHQVPPAQWEVLHGTYNESMRLCFLPTNEE